MHYRSRVGPYICCVLSIFQWTACASDDADPSEPTGESRVETYLGLTQPQDGIQVRSLGAEIMPGEDVEYCEVARLPGGPTDTYFAKSFELGNAKNSHHLIVSAAVPGGPAEAKLMALGEGNKVECFGASQAFGDGFQDVSGSQQPYREVILPEGIGREYRGEQWIVFDYHYLNTTDEVVEARSAVNIHLTERETIKHLARDFGFDNYTIDTPPMSQASFTGECQFKSDVMLGAVTRHTHRWGTDYSVWFTGGERDGEEIWTSNDWQHDVNHTFDKPVMVRAGEGLRFRCSYQNDTPRPLRYGTSATDEMCILFGTVWEVDGDPTLASQGCSIVWTDDKGVGHSAKDAGGFPAPPRELADTCLAGSPKNDCARCRCESCAAPLIQCIADDSACKTISDCYSACAAGSDCNEACRITVDEHSSGIGHFQQMTGCFNSRCASECAAP